MSPTTESPGTNGEHPCHRLDHVDLGINVRLGPFLNLYGCKIGDNCVIGAFVEIQRNVTIGNNCKISSHTFVCEGVTMHANCFVGHGVTFINDNHPRATNTQGFLERAADWQERFVSTVVGPNVSIGSNATILGGTTIGEGAVIGAGSVVTRDVPPGSVWAGNPARALPGQESK